LVSVEEQLEKLRACDILLNPAAELEELYVWHKRSKLEATLYYGIIAALSNNRSGNKDPLCNTLWACDFTVLADNGRYTCIFERLELMTNGALYLSDITDCLNVHTMTAWIKFYHNKTKYKW